MKSDAAKKRINWEIEENLNVYSERKNNDKAGAVKCNTQTKALQVVQNMYLFYVTKMIENAILVRDTCRTILNTYILSYNVYSWCKFSILLSCCYNAPLKLDIYTHLLLKNKSDPGPTL